MAEVKCFQHSKNCTKKNINYLRIQRFKRLIHWFHFDPVRDLSHLLIVKTFLFHSAAEFLCERKSSIFWRRQKSCSIHHRQIRLRSPKERAVFIDCLERIWSPKRLSHQPNKILCHLSHPTDFFATQILGGHVTSRNQGLSSNDQGRQRRETLGTRLQCPGQLGLESGPLPETRLPSWFKFSRPRKIRSFHVVDVQRTAKKCSKNYIARAQPLFYSLNLLFGDVPGPLPSWFRKLPINNYRKRRGK